MLPAEVSPSHALEGVVAAFGADKRPNNRQPIRHGGEAGQQLANLKTQFDQFRQVDQTSPRPIGQGVVTAGQSGIETSIAAILKLEIALKRSGSPP